MRWERQNRPWRPTLRGVVVAGPRGVVELTGASAAVWRLLEAPATRAELAVALVAAGAVSQLEESDPLGILLEHELIRSVS
jgi:hypothetical protein